LVLILVFIALYRTLSARTFAESQTAQINNELEAFTYSISHDLRAPLRSISGYSKMLEEDYGDTLDEEAQKMIRVIMNNGKRMGQLIDQLLEFSRISRKEIAKSKVDMNMVVKTAVMELTENKGTDARISLNITPLEQAVCDISMIRQLWLNLISNAIKFSSKKKHGTIEIGCYKKDNRTIYYIKDDGVGFDMKYTDKLFGVFQRLHKIQEFEGTGVGLALVHRIVMRHGGKIWTQAKVNDGATFSF